MQDARWRQVQEVFFAAADLPPGQRQEYLSTACATDPALLAEVEALLQADRSEASPLGSVIEQAADSLLEAGLLGERLGAYRLLREIGRGGMATVFLAHRADDQYEKEVAVKLVRRGMDTDDILARFRAERQILADLDHPYCARLLDGGSAPDGRPFLVMEYVAGERIDDYAREHNLDLRPRCELFLKFCEAVAHAHRRGVIHRDIKPANMLVTADGQPKLLDFGVAKLLESGRAGPQALTTADRGPLYTPDYASPEQVLGQAASAATDVYSLGAVLFQLLAGMRPHAIAEYSPEEIRKVVCERPVGRASEAAAAVFGTPWSRRIAGDLDAIVAMAMRREPERRYASVEEFAADLRAHLDQRPVKARRDSASYRLGKWVRRHQAVSVAAVVLLLALVGGGEHWRRQLRQTEARRLYESARERLVQYQEYSVEQAVGMLRDSIQLNPRFAAAHASLAEAASWLADHREAERPQWESLERTEARDALALDANSAEAHAVLGNLCFFRDWVWQQGATHLREAARLRPRQVSFQVRYIMALTVQGRLEEALEAVDRADRALPGQIEYQIQRALTLLYLRRNRESIEMARRIVLRDPNGMEGRWVLGMALVQDGQLAEGIHTMEPALNLEHRSVRLEAALGHAYGVAGDRARALRMIETIQHPPAEVAREACYVCQALVYAGLGDGESTVRWLERARDRREASVAFVPVDPRYGPVRDDPRFIALVAWIRRGQAAR